MKLAKVSILVGLALCAILVFSTSILADLEDMCRFENRLNVSPAPQPEAVKSVEGTYQGYVRLYIVEKFAMRYSYSDGSKLTMGYLDMPYNEAFDLEYQETVVDTQIWNGSQTGFSDVLDENVMVIAAVYNDSTFTQNSTPGYSPAQYFTARHVDAAAGADISKDWPNQRTETFTHSVLAEEATEYWWPNCPSVGHAFEEIYGEARYPFFYIAFETYHNTRASAHMSAYSLYYLPTTYLDGGDTVKVGGVASASSFYGLIEGCGARVVPKLDLSVTLEALGNTEFRAIYTLTNQHYPSDPPSDPSAPVGDATGAPGIEYDFSTVTTDPEGDDISYRFDFGDGTVTDWLGPFASGDVCTASHTYNDSGTYEVIAQARDQWEYKTEWSPVSEIKIYDYLVGDANQNGAINILDIVYLIDFLYNDGPEPIPFAAGDVNGSITINILDIVYLIDYKYNDGPAPVYP